GAHILQHFEIDLRGWRVRVCLVAALHQAANGRSARSGGSSTAPLNPSLTSNHSRGLNLLSSKIELVQSVHMANCWPKHAAQCTQLKRCNPLSHRARNSTAALPQRGHITPLGQRNCRK